MKKKSVVVIGSGFAGLSAASFMARAGWSVTVLERNDAPGGRARQLKKSGFTFDMGPSWYWMPDVFEKYFNAFDKTPDQYYSLLRLNPSYRVYWEKDFTDLPADFDNLKTIFEKIEPGSARQLERFLTEAEYKYRTGVGKLVYKPGLSLSELMDRDILKGIIRLDIFTSIKKHIEKHFKNPRLRMIMEFPVLFLGALPERTPALYSLMNYADIKGGTWYPAGGMYSVVEGMYHLARELGVNFHFNEEATEIRIKNSFASSVISALHEYEADAVISAADYHFTENRLLQPEYRSYSSAYWQKRVMAPSCLLYYIGLKKRLKNITHHSLFFDTSFERHGKEIYDHPQWPSDPMFYVSAASVSDPGIAPEGCENLVFLIPVASGLKNDDETLRNRYFDLIVQRMEKRIGEPVAGSIIVKETYSVSDFVSDYNSFRGNAYGLANTLWQTAFFKPSCRSKKVKNLFYAGQLTVPGPGVPPSLISGEVAAGQVLKEFG